MDWSSSQSTGRTAQINQDTCKYQPTNQGPPRQPTRQSTLDDTTQKRKEEISRKRTVPAHWALRVAFPLYFEPASPQYHVPQFNTHSAWHEHVLYIRVRGGDNIQCEPTGGKTKREEGDYMYSTLSIIFTHSPIVDAIPYSAPHHCGNTTL